MPRARPNLPETAMVVGVEGGPERKRTRQYHACHEDHEEVPPARGQPHPRLHVIFMKEVAVLREVGTS